MPFFDFDLLKSRAEPKWAVANYEARQIAIGFPDDGFPKFFASLANPAFYERNRPRYIYAFQPRSAESLLPDCFKPFAKLDLRKLSAEKKAKQPISLTESAI